MDYLLEVLLYNNIENEITDKGLSSFAEISSTISRLQSLDLSGII